MTKSNNKQYINMENKKQTAVEWLIAELIKTIDYDNSQNVEDLRIKLQSFIITSEKNAKEMEKEQIIDADLNATIRTAKGANADVSVRRVKELGEQYYNETYGGNK